MKNRRRKDGENVIQGLKAARAKLPLKLIRYSDRHFSDCIARVLRCDGFDQQDQALFVSGRAMQRAFGHYQKLALADGDGSILKIHLHFTAHDPE